MPIYESETVTREDLWELRKKNRCKECGGMLNVFLDMGIHKAYLACNSDQSHQGIEREASPLFEPNILTRREEMVEEIGEAKATSLERYQGVVSLTQVQAIDILRTIWPDAPDVEVIKAAMICHQYGLNPLMKHVALIKFKRRNKQKQVIGEDWVTVMEISSNRLIARRHHNYSYLDLTPRRMTEEEQKKINGEVDDTKIWALTHLKDVETGAEAFGAGFWPLGEEVHGENKGNTPLNMAKIRSERQALNRLYPAEMPIGVEMMDEKYIDADFSLIDEGGGKIGATRREVRGKKATVSPPPNVESQKIGVPAAELEGEGFRIDLSWLGESLNALKWTNDTAKTFLASQYKVSPQGTLEDVIKRLTREQAEDFVKEINKKLENQQPGLL